MRADQYTYSVAWDGNEIQYWAKVAEFPSLSFFADTKQEALDGLRDTVASILEDMKVTGERPPSPKTSA